MYLTILHVDYLVQAENSAIIQAFVLVCNVPLVVVIDVVGSLLLLLASSSPSSHHHRTVAVHVMQILNLFSLYIFLDCDSKNSHCSTCNSTASFCLSCIAPYLLNDNTCVTQCPAGKFNFSGECTSM